MLSHGYRRFCWMPRGYFIFFLFGTLGPGPRPGKSLAWAPRPRPGVFLACGHPGPQINTCVFDSRESPGVLGRLRPGGAGSSTTGPSLSLIARRPRWGLAVLARAAAAPRRLGSLRRPRRRGALAPLGARSLSLTDVTKTRPGLDGPVFRPASDRSGAGFGPVWTGVGPVWTGSVCTGFGSGFGPCPPPL